MAKQPIKLEKETYTIEVNYSEEAVNKKLMKFIPVDGKEFEISAEEMISFLVNQVNMNTLSPTFVETDKINICQIRREIKCKLDRDFKSGEEINIGYVSPYPLEFALLEEMYNIAKVQEDAPVFTLTEEFIEETKKKLTPEMEDFTKKFYEGHKGLNLGNESKI